MARIFNGFDALGLGQAVNNLHNGMQQQSISALEKLAGGLQDAFAQRREEQLANEQKMAAIDLLSNSGMYDRQKAENMVGALGAGEAAKFLTGQLATQDEREYNKGLRDEQWKHDLEDWTKKNDITYAQAVKQMQFGNLMQQLGLISAKDWGNSRQGVDQYNDTIGALKAFSEKNPEFMDVLGIIQQGMKGSDNKYFDEDIKARLRELGSKGVTDQQREDYLKELIRNDKFSYILDNPNFSDAKSEFIANVNNKKLMPFVNLQKLIGTNTTQTQRNKQINEAHHAAYIKSLKEQIQLARRGKAPWPKIQNKKDVDEIRQDKIYAQMMKGHY